ncbi:reverse transcriptase Ty1/copia-type domain-containing protein [Citrus sinensis]|nr:reverse transcriptase Ty1/copia-type domain-containing protein [Citrus sinensis]
MLIACSEREDIEALKQLLNSEFDMKDLGPTKKILGMEIIRNRRNNTMILSQRKYLEKVLESFVMSSNKSVVTPLASHFKLSCSLCLRTDEERCEMIKVPYASVVGCMMYAMVLTRPDLTHALSVVSRFMASPDKEHWKVVKWVLRYLKGTHGYGLVYGKSSRKEVGLCGFVDSDFARDLDKRSSSAIYLSKNPAHHKKTKHIDIKLHFIRNVISKGVISMVKVHTDNNPADMLTKVVPTAKFKSCLDKAGLSNSSNIQVGKIMVKGDLLNVENCCVVKQI